MILNPFKYYSKKYKERKLNSKQLAKMMNRWPPSIANRIKVVNISDDFMKNVEFLEFCVFEQIWLPECLLFTCKTKLFCVLGDAGVDFMEFLASL